MNELIKKISKVIDKIKPQIIYLPFKDDIHTDHKKIFEACLRSKSSFSENPVVPITIPIDLETHRSTILIVFFGLEKSIKTKLF